MNFLILKIKLIIIFLSKSIKFFGKNKIVNKFFKKFADNGISKLKLLYCCIIVLIKRISS